MSRAENAKASEQLVSEADQTATTLPWSVDEDHDRFARTEHGWKFVSRRWVELFSRGDVINPP